MNPKQVISSRIATINNSLKTVEQALSFSGAIFERSKDFDGTIDHVLTLLKDAVVLFERQSFGSAAFLAITAMPTLVLVETRPLRRLSSIASRRLLYAIDGGG